MVAGGSKWAEIAKRLPGRLGEAIRDRYVNVLDPSMKKTPWTAEEDAILFKHQKMFGNKWVKIGKFLPGRPENSIKNRYYNRLHSQQRKIKHAAVAMKTNSRTQKSEAKTMALVSKQHTNVSIGE
jgi:hypothetical protein